ncbi:MAG: PD40 domain-containing protein [Deltaproteobacteria bacterium]|nr:PD40 domain-containing protein [Deltaproteobacteria bacterium]
MSRASIWRFAVLALSFGACPAAAAGGRPLLRQPSLGPQAVAFTHGGDIWLAPVAGGVARRLTADPGLEMQPHFSPDGAWIAYTGGCGSNPDVYVVPAAGGAARRLTWHPGVDIAIGWTPDSQRVLIRSERASHARFDRLFSVPLRGGLAEPLPLPMGEQASFSPDGERLAYVPYWNRRQKPCRFAPWNNYRGGRASPIWIARLSDSHVEAVPRKGSNDFNPMWLDADRLFFLSDRDGPAGLYLFDLRSRQVARQVAEPGPAIGWASARGDAIVVERFGQLFLFDTRKHGLRQLDIRIQSDRPALRPRWVEVAGLIGAAGISPSGARAVFEARGEIWTLPAEHGDVRNLTRSAGAAERDPAWSPDGEWIACFSDRPGEYVMKLIALDEPERRVEIALGQPASFYYQPVWSPDSKRIAYHDKRLGLWVIDVSQAVRGRAGRPQRIDADSFDDIERGLDPAWSPDGRHLAYTRQERNHLRALWIYSVETGRKIRLTDASSDVRYAVFDRGGEHLYFTASTDSGPAAAWLDLSSYQRPVSRSVYLAVLRADAPSPLMPLCDEEKGAAPDEPKTGKDEKPGKKNTAPVRIDVDGLDQRILALPVPARRYVGLQAGKAGELYLLSRPTLESQDGSGDLCVERFSLAERKVEPVLDGLEHFRLSEDAVKMLYARKKEWFIAPAGKEAASKEHKLDTAAMRMRVEPLVEWRQIFAEALRIERDFFYDPGHHGIDLGELERRYAPLVDLLASREELACLLAEMLGHLSVGHLYVDGGDLGAAEAAPGGLLGADYEIDRGRYRFERVLHGENWNADLRAPLTEPGARVEVGEYLLEIDGRELGASDNVHAALEHRAGTPVRLRVGPRPDGRGSRELRVVPIESEQALRHRAWIAEMRRRTDELGRGEVAYVYLPNTARQGYESFNRYYFAGIDRQAVVIDERFNGGGYAADYIVDHLRRALLNYWCTREGGDFTTPLGAIFGPRVMIINEFAGSGGDALPWYFRRMGLGPLVGKRSWGGLVGIFDYPRLIDGAFLTAPRLAFWSPDGAWDVENRGVAPDVEVELDPAAWRRGRDPQLEKAVEMALEALERRPPVRHRRPAYPRYRLPAPGPGGERHGK